jgi:hypothetical protein
MRYLKLFENFIQSGGDTQALPSPSTTTTQQPGWAPPLPDKKPGQRGSSITNQPLFASVKQSLIEAFNNPVAVDLFNQMVEGMQGLDNTKFEYLFQDIYTSSEILDNELSQKTYENFDSSKMAREALFYLATVGVMGAAVKLFYMLGDMVFEELNKGGFYSVAGGVLLILLFLAFRNMGKKVTKVEEIEEINEKRTKKEGKDTLRASSFAYVPDKDKPSTWKLRIDDANHVRSAVAALGKGFRGNKVRIPADEKDSVIRKVRAAYKKFYPEIVKEEGYPKALELK